MRVKAPLVVLDDDPTGTQAMAGVPVLLEWTPELLRDAAAGAKAVHLLTNARAYPAAQAHSVVRDAAACAAAALERPQLLLRGDSTLRAHLLEEYLAVCEAAHGGRTPPLLLVPALPAAGRVTAGGVHFLVRNGSRVPLHETEYARDPAFAYRDARLLAWAEERSGGFFRGADGLEIDPAGVAEALRSARPRSVVVPDAESVSDLELIADGLREADVEVVVRSAPTFAGVLSGTLAAGPAAPPRARRLLVVCGSYVPATTRQLAALLAAHPHALVEVDVRALASPSPEAEIERAAREAARRAPLAVLTTPRERPEETTSLEAGARIAENLARTVRAIDPAPDVVVTKGGVTSAVTARVGLGAARAHVVGPLVEGVSLWQVASDSGTTIPYVVFPGNVGADETLREVVDLLLAA